MENFNLLDGSDTLKASRDTINNNLLSVRSLSSGTAFPTDNLSVGMLCYRTDLKRLYQYKEDGSWTADIAMSISGNANTANSAGSAANANHADTADTCTGNAATATTAETCTGNSATATALKTARNINGVSFDGSKNIDIPVGVKTVNGIEPDANGDVVVAGLPVGHIYFSLEKTVPTGTLPLNGGTYAHLAYIDLWNYILEQGNYLTFDEWQAMYDANGGNVPFYAITQSGSQSQWRFRVPSINGWVKGASSLEEVGSYLKAGLPNIEGQFMFGGGTEIGVTGLGAFYDAEVTGGAYSSGHSNGTNNPTVGFNASLSNAIYGNSDTVQPPSVVGMWLVKAFGTVSNVGNQDIADVSAGLTRVENKMDEYTDNVAYIEAFIVETWVSDDGLSWYHKYNNGWIDQGGYSTTDVCSFAVPFSDTNYTLTVGYNRGGQATSGNLNYIKAWTTTSFTQHRDSGQCTWWRASGF